MNKMNVSPPREKPEAAEDVEMKEEPQGDLPQSPKVEPTEIVTPTEVCQKSVTSSIIY
jgi:hypothetical protein